MKEQTHGLEKEALELEKEIKDTQKLASKEENEAASAMFNLGWKAYTQGKNSNIPESKRVFAKKHFTAGMAMALAILKDQANKK